MDSLTKRLLSTSGLDSSRPLLPPVQNMRMVYLKEPFGDAETALHEARLALEKVNSSGVAANTDPLYEAMAKLEVKERDYFARRYFGRNKAVLNGWNNEWKQKLFKEKIWRFIVEAERHHKNTNSTEAKQSAESSVDVAHLLLKMHKMWYDGTGERLTTRPRKIRVWEIMIGDKIKSLRLDLENSHKPPCDQDCSDSIAQSLRSAETCKRLADIVMRGGWELPEDLKEPPSPTP